MGGWKAKFCYYFAKGIDVDVTVTTGALNVIDNFHQMPKNWLEICGKVSSKYNIKVAVKVHHTNQKIISRKVDISS